MMRPTLEPHENRIIRSVFVTIVVITAVYLAVRLPLIGRAVTTDEPFWLGRSANFYRAITHHEWEYTYQMAHPGVMTMWAGTLAYIIRFPDYASLATGNLTDPYLIESVLREMGQDPLAMMRFATIVKLLVQAAFFAISVAYLTRLVGSRAATIAGGVFALSPMLIGYAVVLHVDGLFTEALVASVLALAWAAESMWTCRRLAWPHWVIGGILSGMAILTRTTGLVLVGAAGLVLLLQLVWPTKTDRTLWQRFRACLAIGLTWAAVATATIVALFPALWAKPHTALSKLVSWSTAAVVEGHENPSFFNGIHQGDPGKQVYAYVLAWRSTPVEWIGILLLLTLGVWTWWRQRQRRELRLIITILVVALVYTVAMSIGAKKFDRYVLPPIALLSLAAGLGYAAAVEWLGRQAISVRVRQAAIAMIAVVVLSGQSLALASTWPWELDYYNPILGGPTTAQNVLEIGWGEGGREVAADLTARTADGPIVVQTTANPSAFTYFLPDNTPVHFAGFGIGSPSAWYETDYFVAGIQQTQRNMSPGALLLRDSQPVQEVRINGVPYFSEYAIKTAPLPASLQKPTACNATFNAAYTLMEVVGRKDTVDLYFMSLTDENADALISVTFDSPTGERIPAEATLAAAPQGVMTKAVLSFPADQRTAPLETYRLEIQLSTPGTPAEVTVPWDSQVGTAFSTTNNCYTTPIADQEEPPAS